MKYRKRPVEVEAMQFVGDPDAVFLWADSFDDASAMTYNLNAHAIFIETLEGTMRADANDWIIRGVHGEMYPCKPDIFEATYEPLEGDDK